MDARDARRLLRRHRHPLALLAATAALFLATDLHTFLSAGEFAGRDLVSNHAFAHLMRDNLIHGEVVRWTDRYFLGFPSFALYPPLFFLAVAIADLATLSALGITAWFKALVFLPLFLLPLATYRSLRGPFSRRAAFYAGAYTLYFLFVYPPVALAYQAFSTGLVAQGFAAALLLPAVGLLLRTSLRARLAAGLLLGFTTLAHPFVGLAGFAVAGAVVLLRRDLFALVPPALGAVVAAPWLLVALRHLPHVATYTFAPARAGSFLLLLLPLVLLGGFRGWRNRALLLAFAALAVLALVELPLVTQELRFYTYALGLASLLAGLGADRVHAHLADRVPAAALAAVLVLPVLGLSLHAGLPALWTFHGDADPLYDELRGLPDGRVLVETANDSMHDSYVLQAEIPLRTDHAAVNDVHLDSSPAANAILTVEAWISDEPLYNPICRTCDTSAPPSLVDRRLDDLGIRYVVARTLAAADRLDGSMRPLGRHGDYWLFENREGFERSVEVRPVAVTGTRAEWRAFEARLLVANATGNVVFAPDPSPSRYRAVVSLGDRTPREAVAAVRSAAGNATPLTLEKTSVFPPDPGYREAAFGRRVVRP